MTWRNCSGVSRVAGVGGADAGVVDQDVDPAELRHRGVDERLAVLGQATSVRTAIARRPAASTACCVSASRSARRAPSTTSAPASASVRAKTAPSPDDAPVTIATRPSSRNMSRIVRSATGAAPLVGAGRPPDRIRRCGVGHLPGG